MVIYLEKTMERLNSGDQKDYLRNALMQSQHWSDDVWKSTMAKGGGNKKEQREEQRKTEISREEERGGEMRRAKRGAERRREKER